MEKGVNDLDPSKINQFVFEDMLIAVPVVLNDAQENDGKMRVRFKATQANVVNSNNRMYPLAVLADGVEATLDAVKSNRMVGESPHPKHYLGKNGVVVFDTSIDNSVIKIYNHFIEDGIVYVDSEILDTAKGKDLRALIDAGIPVGISMRAVGDSAKKQIGNVMVDVATKLNIQSYDVVMNPATAGCEVVAVLTDSQVEEVLSDGVNITMPVCPDCGGMLQSKDPDNDGDIDFYYCPADKTIWMPSENKVVTSRASQTLEKFGGDSDWDAYSLARQFAQGMTDSVTPQGGNGVLVTDNKEDDNVDLEKLLAAMKDSPEFAALIENAAQAKVQPIIDAQNAAAEAQLAAEALSIAKVETKTFVDGKVAELKGKVADEVLTVVVDSVKDVADKATAETIIDSVLSIYSKTVANQKVQNAGITDSALLNQDGGGVVRVQVTNEHAPWEKQTREMLDSFDRVAAEQGHAPDQSIRKVNKPVVDQIIGAFVDKIGNEALKDSVTFMDSVMNDNASISVTTSQLLNQPMIQQALLIQAFQDVESLQFMITETFQGSEVRWPVETFTSAATVNPATGVYDMLVGEGAGIPESEINLAWLTFNPAWRRNAISLSTDVVNVLKSGPAKYDAVARGLYHIAFDKRRKLDNLAYLEMAMAADEYKPTSVASETGVAGDYTAGSGNVAYVYKSTNGGAATSTRGTNPIVRPRTKVQILPSGQTQSVTSNAVSVTVGGAAKTMGYLDANGNIQGGDYAVDFENGIWYFATSAGLNPTATTPVLASMNYNAVTNYDRWTKAIQSPYTTADQYYNTLLQLITQEVATMGSSPRFQRPNLGVMSLNAATYIENAAMWYKFNSPDLGNLSGLADSTYFGSRSGVNFARINAPTVFGDNRIILTQKGATRYAVETAYQIEGPYPKYDTNGNIVDAKVFYGRENSIIATPQTIDTTGAIINPKSRSIKLV